MEQDMARTGARYAGRRASAATLAAVLALVLATAPVGPAHAASCAGVEMPRQVDFSGATLVLNGIGLREATFLNVDVYVAGLYLPSRSDDPDAILSREEKRLLALELVRDVTREEMMEAFTEGMRKNAGDDYPHMRGRMDRLAELLPPLQKGSRIRFGYLPGQGTAVIVDDQVRGTLEGADFGRHFFAIWLSEHAADPDLREGLLGGDGC